MKELFFHIKYFFLMSRKDKGLLFWAILYPLILVSFFHFAFGGLASASDIKIRVSIEKPVYKASKVHHIDYHAILSNIPVFEPKYLETSKAKAELLDKKTDAFIDSDGDITISESGIKQNIIKAVLDNIKQVSALSKDYAIDYRVLGANYVESDSNKSNIYILPFISLLGMISIYSMFSVAEFVKFVQANLSPEGRRFYASPAKKHLSMIAMVVVSLFINWFIANSLVLLYMKYVLKMSFIKDLAATMLVMLLGNVFGAFLGAFINISSKVNDDAKNGIMVTFSLIGAFLSGMMALDIKSIIHSGFPLLEKINPIDLVSMNIMNINLYGDYSYMGDLLAFVLVSGIIMIGISWYFLRRQRYDSL